MTESVWWARMISLTWMAMIWKVFKGSVFFTICTLLRLSQIRQTQSMPTSLIRMMSSLVFFFLQQKIVTPFLKKLFDVCNIFFVTNRTQVLTSVDGLSITDNVSWSSGSEKSAERWKHGIGVIVCLVLTRLEDPFQARALTDQPTCVYSDCSCALRSYKSVFPPILTLCEHCHFQCHHERMERVIDRNPQAVIPILGTWSIIR